MTLHSPFIKPYLNNISKINNHISFYLFVIDQFKRDSSKLMSENQDILISELYTGNNFSSAFNIKSKDFENAHEQYRNSLLINLFINSYSFIEFYLDDMSTFMDRITAFPPNTTVQSNNKSKFQTILDKISPNTNEVTVLGKEMVDTLNYIRLRRNRIVHSGGATPSSNLKTLVSNNGNSMLNYWRIILPKNVIYFPKHNLDILNHDELIAYFNMSRRICEKMDEELMKIINKNYKGNLINESLSEFLIINKSKLNTANAFSIRYIKNKFSKFTYDRYGVKISMKEVENLLNSHFNLGV